MNLLSYFNFIIENSGFFRLYYSDSFRNILKIIKSNSDKNSGEYAVSIFLLKAENSNQMVDKNTLIDITDKNDTISFIQSNRILRKNPHLSDGILGYDIIDDKNGEFWKKGRTNINIGRWSRRIIKDIYKTSAYSDSMIEKFVNAYKSTFDLLNNVNSLFEIVEGEEIRKWYLESNYKKRIGQLGNSCMRGASKQKFLDIYVKNPEVCKLLILKDGEDKNKIVGRSLLWILSNGKKYQDRIYTINDSDKVLFEKWSENNDYLNYDSPDRNLKVVLGNHSYEYYPYMDTFVVYNPYTKVLCDDEDLWPGQGYIKITNTDGSYQSDDVVWSEYHYAHIDRESAVECNSDYGTDWLYKHDAIRLEYRSEWWVPCDEIVWSEFHEEHFHIDDVVHSEKLNDWLWTKSKDVIEIESNSYGDVDYVTKKRTDLYFEIDGKYYDRSTYIKDPYTGEYEFKDKMMDGYKTYNKYLLERLEEELGKDKDLMIEKVIGLFKDGKYPDIKDSIKESEIYENIWGVYWGLSKDKKPTEDDMVCLLFTAIVSSTGMYFPSYIKKFSDDVYNKYNTWYNTDIRLISRINRFIKSFDYTLLGDDIYKIYLWFSL